MLLVGGGVAHSHLMAVMHFAHLRGLLDQLGLQEATHKATPPTTSLVWLGLLFDREAMTVTLPPVKLREILDLVISWDARCTATRHDLQVLMGKLLYVAQVCSPARLFLNRMLETLRASTPLRCQPSPHWFP